MAITINGFIAKENDDTSFVSEIEWDNFLNMIKNAGNMIIRESDFEAKLKLLETKKLSDNEIQLHYQVLK